MPKSVILENKVLCLKNANIYGEGGLSGVDCIKNGENSCHLSDTIKWNI